MRWAWTEFPLISHLDRVLAPRWSYSHKEIGRNILFWTRIIFIGRVELLRVCEVKSDIDLMDEHIIALLGRLELILRASLIESLLHDGDGVDVDLGLFR